MNESTIKFDTKSFSQVKVYGDSHCQLHAWLLYFNKDIMKNVVKYVHDNDFKADGLGNKTFSETARGKMNKNIVDEKGNDIGSPVISGNKEAVLYLRAYIALKLVKEKGEKVEDATCRSLLGLDYDGGTDRHSLHVDDNEKILEIMSDTLDMDVAFLSNESGCVGFHKVYKKPETGDREKIDITVYEGSEQKISDITGNIGALPEWYPENQESAIDGKNKTVVLYLADNHWQSLIQRHDNQDLIRSGVKENEDCFVPKFDMNAIMSELGIPVVEQHVAAQLNPDLNTQQNTSQAVSAPNATKDSAQKNETTPQPKSNNMSIKPKNTVKVNSTFTTKCNKGKVVSRLKINTAEQARNQKKMNILLAKLNDLGKNEKKEILDTMGSVCKVTFGNKNGINIELPAGDDAIKNFCDALEQKFKDKETDFDYGKVKNENDYNKNTVGKITNPKEIKASDFAEQKFILGCCDNKDDKMKIFTDMAKRYAKEINDYVDKNKDNSNKKHLRFFEERLAEIYKNKTQEQSGNSKPALTDQKKDRAIE